jgi:hypothetical protein
MTRIDYVVAIAFVSVFSLWSAMVLGHFIWPV